LTAWGIKGGAFSVALIPYTLQVTNLRDAKAGSLVSLEADVIAKYVERLLAARGLTPGSFTRPSEPPSE
jgi:riboflavin synthase